MKYQLKELTSNGTHWDHVWVQSCGMGIYLLKVSINGREATVFEGDRPASFACVGQIRASLAACVIDQAELLHQSTYDEMIGNPGQAGCMKLPLNLNPSPL